MTLTKSEDIVMYVLRFSDLHGGENWNLSKVSGTYVQGELVGGCVLRRCSIWVEHCWSVPTTRCSVQLVL